MGLVALMVALSTMSYFDRTIMSIAGPGIMRELGISPTRMGIVYSAFLFSYTLFMMPGGALADRLGARLVLTGSGLGAALFTGMTALCGAVPGFVTVRLLFGVCTAPLYPSCGKLTANWFTPETSARVQALIMSGAALGGAISPVLFAAMIGRFGWRASFWMAAAATVAFAAFWFWYVRDEPTGSPAQFRAPAARRQIFAWKLLRDRNLVLLTLAYFCVNYFEYIFFYWIYYYFGEIRHMGASESALYVTILMLTMVVMTPLGGWVSDHLVTRYGRRWGRRAVPLAGMTFSAVLLYVGAGGLGVYATVALLSLAFGFSASSEGVFWASAIDAGGEDAGSACGILNTGGNAGGILAPVFTPMIAARLGWTWGLYAGSFVVLLGVAAWFFIDPAKRPARRLGPERPRLGEGA
jgi:MFS family permease